MYQIIHDYVQNCDVCQCIKVDSHRHPVHLNPLPEEKESFDMRTREATEVASILDIEIITRYGAPRTIVSDRARNFMSKLVAALCEMFRVTRHYTSSYHPQTNATVSVSIVS